MPFGCDGWKSSQCQASVGMPNGKFTKCTSAFELTPARVVRREDEAPGGKTF